MNFEYVINPEADEPIMVIDSHIGPDGVGENGVITKGIDGAKWARELLMLDSQGKRRVQVYINSPGGIVTDGYSICSAMLHTKCKVDTYCIGLAASIAAVAFMCGRDRCMADYSILMFHDPYGGSNSEALEKMKNSIATLISTRSNLTIETVLAIMAKTSFLDASEAMEIPGLITDIQMSSDANKGRLTPVKNDAKAFWKQAQTIFNSALNIKPKEEENKTPNTVMTDFKTINNRLGLMDEANEASRTKALDAIINKAEMSDKKAEDLAKKCAEMEDAMNKQKATMEDEAKKQKEAYDKMEAEFTKMKEAKDAFEKEAKEKEKAETKEKAKNLIEVAVKDGKIKGEAETILKWTNRAEADFTGIKDLLDDMGVNRAGVDFSKVGGGAGDGVQNRDFKNDDERQAYEDELIFKKMKASAENLKRK